ncbi:VOC family protein [Candidatus Berkiella aquae]|uniref:Lactoylglutathione lyase n=1 Tax=Candidatus Berkiella aquae TaxID=295108 RepID=A0A0Q9YMA9_9GAMM|nr:VOC family protein [Candidatus Berkiella aquae]MCS5710399.1 VOC family protein [Candidatus Berkiella aquae]
MRYLHAMVRVFDLEKSLDFYVNKLGLIEIRRSDYEKGRFTLIFLATAPHEPMIELTYNWDQPAPYSIGRNFGHLAFEVDNIYTYCERLQQLGVTILRPPRDGRMAFVRSPDDISIEILQRGQALEPQEPWILMENSGEW